MKNHAVLSNCFGGLFPTFFRGDWFLVKNEIIKSPKNPSRMSGLGCQNMFFSGEGWSIFWENFSLSKPGPLLGL